MPFALVLSALVERFDLMSKKELGQKKRTVILQQIEALELEEVMLADGFDHAILGLVEFNVGNRITKQKSDVELDVATLAREVTVVAYSTKAILESLMDDGMSLEDAQEYFEFNIKGAWVGPATPVYVQDELDLFVV